MKKSKILSELSLSFPVEQVNDCIIIKLDHHNIYNDLHLLFFKFLFQRLVDFFIHSSDESGCSLVLFLEHRDYSVRTRIEIKIIKEFLPLKSFSHLWRNSSYYELLINRRSNIFDEQKLIDFVTDDDQTLHSIKWVPPQYLLKGESILYYKLDQDVISSVYADIGFEHKGAEAALSEKSLELYPIMFKKLFPKHYMSLTVLFYKSIEDILGINIPVREQTLRMVLLELDRIKDVFLLLHTVFHNSNGHVLCGITEDVLSDIDFLFSETPDEHFGLLFPRKQSSKFNAEWIKNVTCFITKVSVSLKKIDRVLSNNSFFYSSQVNTLKEFSYDQQLDGFLLKANGGNHDLRSFAPYYLYSELNISPALGQQKNVMDIYFVWIEELKASVHNIDLLFAGLVAYNDSEVSLIDHLDQFELELPRIAINDDYFSYTSISTLRGELGVWWEYKDGKPFLRLKPAGCFSLIYFLDLAKGLHVEDAFSLLPFMGVNLNELEK